MVGSYLKEAGSTKVALSRQARTRTLVWPFKWVRSVYIHWLYNNPCSKGGTNAQLKVSHADDCAVLR